MATLSSLCVFCGSNPGARPVYKEAASALGLALAEHAIRLVYGGGNVGLMGVLADSVMQAGGKVVGIIPEALLLREKGKRNISELEVVSTMHERKQRMADLADAFVALPGGYGTLEEFCEILTWSQLGIHAKPVALLNIAGFYDSLIALFDHAVGEGFLQPQYRQLVVVEQSPQRLIEALRAWRAPAIEAWDVGSQKRLGT
jgi:uncharacterized protein (TIGR00730 family)